MLESFHIRCLQRILKVTWQDWLPHIEILQKTNCWSIEATLMLHQLRWLGRVVRMPTSCLPRKVLYGQLHLASRSAGGQKKRLKDQLKGFLKKCGIKPTSLETSAMNRTLWQQLCQSGVRSYEDRRTEHRLSKRHQRKQAMLVPAPPKDNQEKFLYALSVKDSVLPASDYTVIKEPTNYRSHHRMTMD